MTQTYVPEIDIYRAAKVTIDTYGGRAILIAMKNIESCHAKGDEGGILTWKRIADAIEWLELPADLRGETCH